LGGGGFSVNAAALGGHCGRNETPPNMCARRAILENSD
jgi:hypothetical protein